MGWVLVLLVVLAPIVTTRRLVARLDTMPEDELAFVRHQATSSGPAWYIRAWAGLLAAAGLAVALQGQPAPALLVLLVAAVLFAAPVLLARRQRELLAALGDRGRIPRTDRYHRRDRWSARWGSLALVGWFVSNLASVVVPEAGGRAWVAGLGVATTLVGAIGWLATRTRMYLAGDDLDEPGPDDRDASTDAGSEPSRP